MRGGQFLRLWLVLVIWISSACTEREIKNQCKKDRIRLLEFFQDHDILRKGYVPNQKFMNVLHIQKINLTSDEFAHL